MNAVVAAGAVMGGIVFVQQVGGFTDSTMLGFGQLDATLVSEGGETQRRLAGPIGETNRFAQIMAVLIPLAGVLAIVNTGLRRWAYIGALVLISAGMALAFSRGAIVALALAVPVALALRVIRWPHVAGAGAVALLVLASMPHYMERVVSIGEVAVHSLGLSPTGFRNADGAARGRLTEMKAAGLIFVDNPVIGAGPGMARVHYPEYAAKVGGKVRPGERRSHNLFLQLASETGLLGLSAFLVVVGMAFWGLERARRQFVGRDRVLWAITCGLELALVVSLATSLFLHAAYIRYFWVLLGLCAAVSTVEHVPVLIRLLHRMLAQTALNVREQT